MPLRKIIPILESWMEQGKTGQVEINFREGQIRNYTVRESFLVSKSDLAKIESDRFVYIRDQKK